MLAQIHEVWRNINGYPNYEVSCHGLVRRKASQFRGSKMLRQCLNSQNGYKYVGLYRNGERITKSVHRIVANTWLNRENITIDDVVDHIDQDKTNNHFTNLRFCSRSINLRNRRLNRNNTSSHKGVSLSTNGRYWIVQINDAIGKQKNKYFSVPLPDAKVRAINCRKQLEINHGYL